MPLRLTWLACLVCLACQLGASQATAGGARAEKLWQDGQAALKAGRPDEAIAHYEESLIEDVRRTQNHLSLAAAYIEKGDDVRACTHLGQFLSDHPEHKNARFYYAELLLRLKRFSEACVQYERAVADGQEGAPVDVPHLVHCHGRLLEVAEGLGDAYLIHLHRGIGLYQLAMARARLEDPDGEMSTEALLCKSAAELAQARARRPQEARACWYLYCVWQQLAQQQHARRWLAEALRAAPFTYLTPAEQTRLHLADQLVTATRP